MISTVLTAQNSGFTWIDVVDPGPDELAQVANTYELHPTSVQDCLDPEHLPKHERIGEITFLILRAMDERAGPDAETVQEATRKVAIFYCARFLITIHRMDQPYLARLREAQARRAAEREPRLSYILTDLINAVADSFEHPLDDAETTIETFERSLFDPHRPSPPLQRINLLKRRVSLVKRLLWQTLTVLHRTAPPAERNAPLFQDVRENVESYHFYADELLEEINNLLGMHLAMASHRTNEVMRVLTVFSAFFLPLTFIVGVYGMNFDRMPELRHPLGYPLILLVMFGVSSAIFLWFRRRGWLRRAQAGEVEE